MLLTLLNNFRLFLFYDNHIFFFFFLDYGKFLRHLNFLYSYLTDFSLKYDDLLFGSFDLLLFFNNLALRLYHNLL